MQRANVLPSDPEWEKMKGPRRSLSHDDAVQEICFLQRQFRLQWSDRVATSPLI